MKTAMNCIREYGRTINTAGIAFNAEDAIDYIKNNTEDVDSSLDVIDLVRLVRKGELNCTEYNLEILLDLAKINGIKIDGHGIDPEVWGNKKEDSIITEETSVIMSNEVTKVREDKIENLDKTLQKNNEVYDLVDVTFHFDNGKVARGLFNTQNNRITLLKGSETRTGGEDNAYAAKLLRKYKKYLGESEVLEDIVGLKVSAAASLVIRRNANGWTTWKDSDGNTLDIYRNIDTARVESENDEEDSDEEENVYDKAPVGYSGYDRGIDWTCGIAPEELLIKGLSAILNRKNVVELSDDTINKLKSHKGNVAVKEEHEWNCEADENSFEDNIVGYNLEECKEMLERKGALLLTGVPGTGKTEIMTSLIGSLAGKDKNKYEIISFHQDYDYEDFVRGLRNINGEWKYVDGILVQMCKRADKDNDGNTYYLGIDEMSRGDTEVIFGEVLTCLAKRDYVITLADGSKIAIPKNLHIIGTMNVTDNSTKKLDTATLERFTQLRVRPQWNEDYVKHIAKKCGNYEIVSVLSTICAEMQKINTAIEESNLGPDKMIGMRSISGIDQLTIEALKSNIGGQLIPAIKRSVKNMNDTTIVMACIKVIEDAIK